MSSFLSSTTLRAKKSLKAFIMGSKALPDDQITPLDCIFACSVCGDVFSDIYKQPDTVHGLSDGINPKERIVTRLYVASCCHVICTKHIEGGRGPAFYQIGQHPQASCPVCAKEKGDDAAKQLFSLRGFNDGEHDPAIPRCWFKAPPMKLEGKDKEMEALRFQYLALTRFSKNVATAYRQAIQDGNATEAKLRNMEQLAEKEHEKVISLEEELKHLRPLVGQAQRLHRLEAKLPAISHYLGIMPMLKEQNDRMQRRLASLGFAMSLEPIPQFTGHFPLDDDGNFVEDPHGGRKTGSSHTSGRSAHGTALDEGVGEEPSVNFRPLKRSRIDSPAQTNIMHAAPSRRDTMPPPPKPLSKMKSIKKLIPSLRHKFSNGRSAEPLARKPTPDTDVQMYDDSQWEIGTSLPPIDIDERPSTRRGLESEAPYMTGTLPADVSRLMDMPLQSGLLSGLGVHGNESKFTFEAPSHMNKSRQDAEKNKLPTEPSYIRLLDDLGQPTDLDLGLDDPRHRSQNERSASKQHTQKLRQVKPRIQTQQDPKQWNFGHAFLEQSPVNANPISAQRFPIFRYSREDETVKNYQDRIPMNSTTPALIRTQRPADEVDHVVSPFLGSSSRHSQPFSRPQFAEPDISLDRSGTYRSRRNPFPVTDWREPRNLNGLSFFSSPVNRWNERIESGQGPKVENHSTPSTQHRARHINSQGFLVRPDARQSPMQHDDTTYGSFIRPSPHSIQQQSQPAVPFLSFNRSSHSRTTATRLPSAMPSIITGCSPVRRRDHAEGLGRLGVRSSQHSRLNVSNSAIANPARPSYSSADRRVIRR